MLFPINPMATLKVAPFLDVPIWEFSDLMMVFLIAICIVYYGYENFVIMIEQCVVRMCGYSLGNY